MGKKKTITLKQAVEGFLEHLRQVGKKERTVYTYSRISTWPWNTSARTRTSPS